jgi:hypothetical protein
MWPLRAAPVWTDVPDLMEIPADPFDRALASPPREGALTLSQSVHSLIFE